MKKKLKENGTENDKLQNEIANSNWKMKLQIEVAKLICVESLITKYVASYIWSKWQDIVK